MRGLIFSKGWIPNDMMLGVALLAGAWSGVGLALGAMMPEPQRRDERLVMEGTQLWRSTFPLQLVGTNPCTSETVVLDVTPVLDIKARIEGVDAAGQLIVQPGLVRVICP